MHKSSNFVINIVLKNSKATSKKKSILQVLIFMYCCLLFYVMLEFFSKSTFKIGEISFE